MSFEAVSRAGSVTQAAKQLDLTQGAVSRHIQKLEDFLNYGLFHREKKRLVLTPLGSAYAETIGQALAQISNATQDLQSNPDGGVLELAILPAFGSHWLAPRLADFQQENPGVALHLTTRLAPFDFMQERFHAAIHFGRDNWQGAKALKLMTEKLVPVYAPLLPLNEVTSAADIVGLPLLSLNTRPQAWQRWFAANEITAPMPENLVFDQFETLLQASLGGLGVALMPEFLVHQDIQRGSLCTVPGRASPNQNAYYLVWPESRETYPPFHAFKNWMATQF
ncbi:LysR family transcriptional regulator [Cognatishimia sp. WU-CL00825]|uniref:LysR family transcriptional regulator n=1 Tax=Cognatishimia sp. WU-CL00825 TaxID=3127658 RepID=UPI0033657CAC